MLTEICAEIRNYFLRDYRKDIHSGTFSISGGSIEPLSFLQEGQYFRIVGSVFNDGVWQYGSSELRDETFTGAVWAMAIPPVVIALDSDIENWVEENKAVLSSPYQSESFGGYSYSKSSGRTRQDGTVEAYTWKEQFASQLNKFRRVSVL